MWRGRLQLFARDGVAGFGGENEGAARAPLMGKPGSKRRIQEKADSHYGRGLAMPTRSVSNSETYQICGKGKSASVLGVAVAKPLLVNPQKGTLVDDHVHQKWKVIVRRGLSRRVGGPLIEKIGAQGLPNVEKVALEKILRETTP